MFKNALSLLVLAMATFAVHGQTDYLDPLVAPATVYEDAVKSPQNMDFDVDKNMFIAHSGWYQDRLIHYYKFRMFTPGFYPGVIAPGVDSSAVPLQNIYFVSDSGDFSGVIGQPIIEYHTSDGVMYSDFMVVNFVAPPEGYVEGDFKSVGDITTSGAVVTPTEIVLNIPVVPTGSTLQHPIEKGTETAPILPVPVLYRGAEVWTYVFEVNDQAAADFFSYTRSDSATQLRQSLVTGFEIPVVPTFANADVVSAIPIWHINQFNRGVEEGNGGGPNPAGMRNIIDSDRPDEGYSPLWRVWWGTEVPINYSADQLSNALDATTANGFSFFITPMFVNCPDIGLVGTEVNPLKEQEFQVNIDLEEDASYIIGSHQTLIMQGGVELKIKADDTVLGTTSTNMMGGYEYKLMSADIPEGTKKIKVVAMDGTILRKIVVGSDGEMMDGDMEGEMSGDMEDETSSASMKGLMAATLLAVPALLL